MTGKYRCEVFTPPDKVNKLLDIINYKKNLYGKKFLENSCGDGAVLKEVVRRYIKDCLNHKMSLDSIKKGLEEDIYGLEISAHKQKDCLNNLNQVAKTFGLNNVKWKISKEDFLKSKLLIKFSFIAGNPPYINYRRLEVPKRNYIKNNFSTCQKGKFDYCYAFIEKSIESLDDNGKLSYLIPSSIFKNVFAENLREYILPYTEEIYDFKTEKVFKNALVATSILVCNKNSKKNYIIYKNEDEKSFIKIPKLSLGYKWVFKTTNVDSTKPNNKIKFGNLFLASISIATLYNNAFVLKNPIKQKDKIIIDDFEIEEKITKIAKSPRGLAYNSNERIIFPYFYKNNKLQRYSETEFETNFPNTVKYLQKFYEKLSKRNNDTSAKWFEYGRSQALAHLNQKKLLMSTVVTDSIKIYDLNKDDIPYAGIYITSKNGMPLEKAKVILSSKNFFEYVKLIGIQASGTSLRITPKDVNNYEFDMEEIS